MTVGEAEVLVGRESRGQRGEWDDELAIGKSR